MKVYRLEQDPDRWKFLGPKGNKYMFIFNVPDDLEEGDSRAATWKSPPVEFVDPDAEECDFSMPDIGALIAHPKATEVLRPLLEEVGELLPVVYKQETYHFLHVTRYINALDWESTKLSSASDIKRYAFLPEKLADVGLFKIATTERDGEIVLDMELYVVEGNRGKSRDFRALFRAHGLRGLEFRKVWSSE